MNAMSLSYGSLALVPWMPASFRTDGIQTVHGCLVLALLMPLHGCHIFAPCISCSCLVHASLFSHASDTWEYIFSVPSPWGPCSCSANFVFLSQGCGVLITWMPCARSMEVYLRSHGSHSPAVVMPYFCSMDVLALAHAYHIPPIWMPHPCSMDDVQRTPVDFSMCHMVCFTHPTCI